MTTSDQDDLRAWDPDPLAVGDRVRVRLSGECPGYEATLSDATAESLGEPWPIVERGKHPEHMNGRIAVVVMVDGDWQHRYVVEDPTESPSHIWAFGGFGGSMPLRDRHRFARVELERCL